MDESTSATTRIPQNIPSRESARFLLALLVPRKFDIARLRPSDLPRGQRFETEPDARARRDADLERFDGIAGLAQVADRLSDCSGDSPCAEVCCALCGRQFRRWLTGQALRHQSGLDLQVVTVALELAPTNRLTDCDLLLVKRRAAQKVRRAAPSAEFVLGGIEAEYRQGDDSFLISCASARLATAARPAGSAAIRLRANRRDEGRQGAGAARSCRADFVPAEVHDLPSARHAEWFTPSKGNSTSGRRVGSADALAGSPWLHGLRLHDGTPPQRRPISCGSKMRKCSAEYADYGAHVGRVGLTAITPTTPPTRPTSLRRQSHNAAHVALLVLPENIGLYATSRSIRRRNRRTSSTTRNHPSFRRLQQGVPK